jgi:hypothetical protein
MNSNHMETKRHRVCFGGHLSRGYTWSSNSCGKHAIRHEKLATIRK